MNKNDWRTDPRVFQTLNKEFDFTLDAAASDTNHLCEFYITKEMDSLKVNWSEFIPFKNKTVFVNPPYGRGYIKKFLKKCAEQKKRGVTSVALIPNSMDAKWLNIADISEIRLITNGRLSFCHPDTGDLIPANTKGSMIVVFRPGVTSCFIRLIDRNMMLNGIIQ